MQIISQSSKNAMQMRIGIDRRGSRNTLRLFRISYVKYSTGAHVTKYFCAPCAAETQFYGRPKGVRTTERETKIRKISRYAFSRVSAISRPAPLFCILFSGKTEKSMPPEAQLRCYRNNGTSGESGKEFRASGAILCPPGIKSLPHPPDAVEFRASGATLRPPG